MVVAVKALDCRGVSNLGIGVRSLARQRMLGTQDAPEEKAEFMAYRCFAEIAELLRDPDLSWLVKEPHQNCWSVLYPGSRWKDD